MARFDPRWKEVDPCQHDAKAVAGGRVRQWERPACLRPFAAAGSSSRPVRFADELGGALRDDENIEAGR
jgi:hypothetical protein